MFELKITNHFAAAHQLTMMSERCEKLHGHNWKIEVSIIGKKLNKSGVLIDFGIIKKHLSNVIEKLDHNFLNDLPFFKKGNPSSENIAIYIANEMKKKITEEEITIKKVKVWESENACATYYSNLIV